MALAKFTTTDIAYNTGNTTLTNGSDLCFLAPCNSSGSVTGTIIQLPVVKESSMDDKTAENSLTSERGAVFKSDGSREVVFSTTLMQGDGATQSIGKLIGGNYYQVVKEESREGTPYYLAIGIAKASKEIATKKPGNDAVLKFNVQENSSAVAINLGNFQTAAGTQFAATLSGTLTIDAGEIYTRFHM